MGLFIAKRCISDIITLSGGDMIERYSLPEMSAVWKDDFKFRTMLEIELLAAEALAGRGRIPAVAASRMR